MTSKIRCPNCKARLPIDSFGDWVNAYCRNCKQVVKLDNRKPDIVDSHILSKVG